MVLKSSPTALHSLFALILLRLAIASQPDLALQPKAALKKHSFLAPQKSLITKKAYLVVHSEDRFPFFGSTISLNAFFIPTYLAL
jgi:hypothetical protein